MTDTVETTAYDVPAFFPAGHETLFGVFCRAAATKLDGTGVLISSGGLTGTSTVGRNQMFVRLARRLASTGVHSLRFDYHGIGESTGVLDEFRLDADQPFVDDILGACHWMQGQGVERLVLLGKCFGSRMALSAAVSVGRLDGLVLIGVPVRDFGTGERAVTRLATELSVMDYVRRSLRPEVIRRLGDARHRKAYLRAATAKARVLTARLSGRSRSSDGPLWISPNFVRPLEALVARAVPVQLVYGVEDEFYKDFQKASQHDPLRAILERAGDSLTVTTTPGQVRGFVQADVQDTIVDAACEWIFRLTTESRARE